MPFWCIVSMQKIDKNVDFQIWLQERCPLFSLFILPHKYKTKRPIPTRPISKKVNLPLASNH